MRKVIILVNTARATGRKFLRGIERYISSTGQWEVCIQPPEYLPNSDSDLDQWFQFNQANGIIARDSIHTNKILELDIPKVISDTKNETTPGRSTISTDSEKTGIMAADYFISLGFKNFAFCGYDQLDWSEKRFESYRNNLLENGYSNIFNYNDWDEKDTYKESERFKIAEWIKTLPKPICIFACNDDRGFSVMEACKIADYKIPEEIAVLGVDNDELICDISTPPLSSIELNFEYAGYCSAALLDEMINNNGPANNIVVDPVSIATRQSTDILAVEDKEVAKAMSFIRENYQKAIQIRDVVEVTNLSRRELELRFRKYIKRSIKDIFTRLRIESIKRRLRESTEPVYMIANSLEYTDTEHFSRYFKQATGLTPSQYRRQIW